MLVDFVERNSHIAGIHWDSRLTPRLLVDPFSSDYKERERAAHFFLFVAAVSETKLIERAEYARYLLVNLHEALGDRLFKTTESSELKKKVEHCGFYEELGSEKRAIPDVLASVNRFVEQVACGDLIELSKRFSKPVALVKKISEHIGRMSGLHIEKSWMYMRWMVRPEPDLGIFKHFSPADLSVPLTMDIINVAISLGLMRETLPSFFGSSESVEKTRDQVTQFVRRLFPDDPAKVDYPFFLLGRWIGGMELNEATLRQSLQLFDEVFRKTGYACVDYQIVAYIQSGWEQLLKQNLKMMEIFYDLKPFKFPLPDGLVYTPDFVLKRENINGKKIILEPHGVMTEEDSHKFSLFRQVYGNNCYLLLLMKNDDITYYRVRGLLPEEAYDDVWPIEYLGMLLTQLKKNRYNPLSG